MFYFQAKIYSMLKLVKNNFIARLDPQPFEISYNRKKARTHLSKNTRVIFFTYLHDLVDELVTVPI